MVGFVIVAVLTAVVFAFYYQITINFIFGSLSALSITQGIQMDGPQCVTNCAEARVSHTNRREKGY